MTQVAKTPKRPLTPDEEYRRQAFIGARKILGYTQQRMADELGASRGSVVRWERGDVPVNERTLKVAVALNEAGVLQRMAARFADAITIYNERGGAAFSEEEETRVFFARAFRWLFVTAQDPDPEALRRALLDVEDEFALRRPLLARWRKERPRRHGNFGQRQFPADILKDGPGAFILQTPAVVMERMVAEQMRVPAARLKKAMRARRPKR
jgi:DNA-binding XRE family transcriptional regulator